MEPHAPENESAESANAWLQRADPQLREIVSWKKWGFSPSERDDALQKIRLNLWHQAESQGQAAGIDLVRCLAIRRCIDVVRARSRERKRLVSMQRPGSASSDGKDLEFREEGRIGQDPLELIDQVERAQHLAGALNDLAPPCQVALRRFYLDNQSYQEIADGLGLHINTVGSRLSKCLDKLRTLLRKLPDLWDEKPPRRRY